MTNSGRRGHVRKFLNSLVAIAVIVGVYTIGTEASSAPGHQVTVNDTTANEGSGIATFTLTVSPAPHPGESVTVKAFTGNGTASGTANCPTGSGDKSQDFKQIAEATPTTVVWNAGETTQPVNVTICDDNAVETNETFVLQLKDPSVNASISRFQGLGTIIDNESAPKISIADAPTDGSNIEGPGGSHAFTFNVSMDVASDLEVKVDFKVVEGTAKAAEDYVDPAKETPPRSKVTFVPGDKSEAITVTVNGDMTFEPDETFFVALSNPTNAKIADPEGVGIIKNDDIPQEQPPNSISINNNVTRDEGNTGTDPATPVSFTVTLNAIPPAPGETISVTASTQDGTAQSGSDYLFRVAQVSFTNGETAKVFTVSVIGDTVPEPDEEFLVNLSAAACSPGCPAVPTISAPNPVKGIIVNGTEPPPTPAPPTPTPTPAPVTTLKIGGYFQVRIKAPAPCFANRSLKVKRSVPGTDKVFATGKTDSTGLFKKAVRPKKRGLFYAQIYSVTIQGTSCPAKKSPVRELPA